MTKFLFKFRQWSDLILRAEIVWLIHVSLVNEVIISTWLAEAAGKYGERKMPGAAILRDVVRP